MIAQLDRIDRCRIAGIAGKGIGEAPFQRFEHMIARIGRHRRSEEHTSELQSLMRISYAVFCLKKKKNTDKITTSANLRRTNYTHRISRKYNQNHTRAHTSIQT